MTVTVDTPNGEVTGSVVRKVWSDKSQIMPKWPHVNNKVEIKGEAVVVDLGEHGVMYGLINWASYNDVKHAFPYGHDMASAKGIRYYSTLPVGKSAELPRENWPTFVTFTDPVTERVDEYLDEEFWDKYRSWVKSTSITERNFTKYFRFKQGDLK